MEQGLGPDAVEAAPRFRIRLRTLIGGHSGLLNSYYRHRARSTETWVENSDRGICLRVCLLIFYLHP